MSERIKTIGSRYDIYRSNPLCYTVYDANQERELCQCHHIEDAERIATDLKFHDDCELSEDQIDEIVSGAEAMRAQDEQIAADAALGRQVREAAAALGVEAERVAAELPAIVTNMRQLQAGLSLDAMRLRSASILARLSPAPAEGEGRSKPIPYQYCTCENPPPKGHIGRCRNCFLPVARETCDCAPPDRQWGNEDNSGRCKRCGGQIVMDATADAGREEGE